MEEVVGSIPTRSTIYSAPPTPVRVQYCTRRFWGFGEVHFLQPGNAGLHLNVGEKP
jgi:hypothetical protein